MRILQRYIFKELWLPCLLCFLTLNFIFITGYLVKVADLIIGRGVPLSDTLYVLLLALPGMVRYTAPMSLLTGVLIVFGSFSQHNEFRAMKASGIHPFRFMAPPLLLGFILSILMLIFNDQIVPQSKFELRKMTKKMIMQNPMALIQAGRFVKIGNDIMFLTKAFEDKKMKDIIAYEGVDSENPVRTIVAETGEIVMDEESGLLEIHLYDGNVTESQGEGVQSIRFRTYKFPALARRDIRRMQKKVKDYSLAEILVKSVHTDADNKRRQLWTIFHQRIAFSFASLIFVFIGIPIAVIVRRGEVIISFGISMLAACFYYVFFAAAQAIASQGALPPLISLWIPNVTLFLLGGYLLKRAIVS